MIARALVMGSLCLAAQALAQDEPLPPIAHTGFLLPDLDEPGHFAGEFGMGSWDSENQDTAFAYGNLALHWKRIADRLDLVLRVPVTWVFHFPVTDRTRTNGWTLGSPAVTARWVQPLGALRVAVGAGVMVPLARGGPAPGEPVLETVDRLRRFSQPFEMMPDVTTVLATADVAWFARDAFFQGGLAARFAGGGEASERSPDVRLGVGAGFRVIDLNSAFVEVIVGLSGGEHLYAGASLGLRHDLRKFRVPGDITGRLFLPLHGDHPLDDEVVANHGFEVGVTYRYRFWVE